MKGIRFPVVDQYYVAYTISTDVFTFGKIESGNVVTSGEEEMERFANEAAVKARTNVIKGDPNWYDENNIHDKYF